MELEIKLDRAGFPVVLIEKVGIYMHWIPITKIQMEYYMAYTSEMTYNDTWYRGVLSFNKRVSPGNVNTANYWEALLTGVKPADALNYARWCNDGYMIPTAREWFDAFDVLSNEPADKSHIEQVLSTEGLKPRIKLLLQNIEDSASQAEFQLDSSRTLADQMLMRLGVMEYVYRDESRNAYGGYGQTHSSFFPQMEIPRRDAPQVLSNAREGAQLKQYGFRLISQRR